MREAPSVEIIQELKRLGAHVKAYDPVSMDRAAEMLPEVTYCATAYDVAKDADALLIVTEWNEFKQLNWEKIRRFMRQPVVVDGRNLYDPAELAARGFTYWGVGRGVPPTLLEQQGAVTLPELVA
jgi:UDPglucose 6-dehydrogenase